MKALEVATKRGTVLNGVIFDAEKKSDTVVIAITGIHGNFYSNPFYFNIGETLSSNGIDFVYAQTNDAFGQIETYNAKTGANKVIHYLSTHHDEKTPEHFIFLSHANLTYMMKNVSDYEKEVIRRMIRYGQGDKMLPFYFMGWVECIADTANDWLEGSLNNVHTEVDGDFSQVAQITHNGAMVIGTYDNFTCGEPAKFLKNINDHMKTSAENKLIFIEKTGHTYQQKEQEIADIILNLVQDWK